MTIENIIGADLARSATASACAESFQLRQLYAVDVRRRRSRLADLHSSIRAEVDIKIAKIRQATDWLYREGDYAPVGRRAPSIIDGHGMGPITPNI